MTAICKTGRQPEASERSTNRVLAWHATLHMSSITIAQPFSVPPCFAQAMGAVRDMWHESFAAILSPRSQSPQPNAGSKKQVAVAV